MTEEKKKDSVWTILRMRNLERDNCRDIAGRSLTLAGFTITGLILVISSYEKGLSDLSLLIKMSENDPNRVTLLIKLYERDFAQVSLFFNLFFASVFLFVLSSILAHEANYLWEIMVADYTQYLGIIVLVMSFAHFAYVRFGSIWFFLFPSILVLTVVSLVIFPGIRDFMLFYRRYLEEKG